MAATLLLGALLLFPSLRPVGSGDVEAGPGLTQPEGDFGPSGEMGDRRADEGEVDEEERGGGVRGR